MTNCHDDALSVLSSTLRALRVLLNPLHPRRLLLILLFAVVHAFCELKPPNSRSSRPTLPPRVCQSENSVSGVGSSFSVWRQPLLFQSL